MALRLNDEDFFGDEPIRAAVPVTRTLPGAAPVNDTSSFGQAGTAPVPVKAPAAPDPDPLAAGLEAQRIASQGKTRATNIAGGHLTGDDRTFSEALQGGGYQQGKGFVKPEGRDAGEFLSDIWRVPAGVAVAPVNATLGNIPGIDNTVRGVTRATVNAPGEMIKEVVNNPATALATGGYSAIYAGADRAFDDVATGVGRDVSGDDKLSINAPLTPGQLYDPNGPIYQDSNTTIQQPGVKQLGEAAAGGLEELVNAFDFGGNGGTGAGGLGGGAAGGALGGALGSAGNARALGAGVMGGQVAAPDPADRAAQQGALGATQDFAGGPRAVDPVMGELDAFGRQAEGPSKAQLLLDKASQDAMADVLSASRSARSRGAGDQARQAAVAQGEIAGMGVDNARNAALLRQQEAQDFIGQQLAALGQKGNLATARDSNTLGALGVGGDLASQMRSAGVAERGDTLGFGQGMEQIAGNLEGDVVGAIPGLEAVRHDDQYELTPEQKLKVALLGGVGDVFSLFG